MLRMRIDYGKYDKNSRNSVFTTVSCHETSIFQKNSKEWGILTAVSRVSWFIFLCLKVGSSPFTAETHSDLSRACCDWCGFRRKNKIWCTYMKFLMTFILCIILIAKSQYLTTFLTILILRECWSTRLVKEEGKWRIDWLIC